jgi:SAM-dependent methyltransferase
VEQTRLFLATDVSLEIVRAASRVDGRPRYAVFSAAEPAIRPGSVDLVVLNQVLHHMPPDCDLLGVVRGLLAAGGQVLVLEPNTACLPGRLVKWLLKRLFGLVMEASPYGQFDPLTIARLVCAARLRVRREWFASLLAFPLTGGLGRAKVVPDSRSLFRLLVWVDEAVSRLLRPVPALGRLLHWRVLYLLERADDPPGST